MPKRTEQSASSTGIPKKKAKVGKEKPRIAANGHRLPDPLPYGEILTDVAKRQWQIGRSIGAGGFGEIYFASSDISKPVGADAEYAVKVEHHTNGPLFAEMHFYHRVGKADLIDEWMKKKKLDFLGMPKFVASGSHEYKNIKYRFMVMDRFGEDLQKILDRNNKVLPLKTVFTLGVRILDVLEYIHSYGYVHADVKASNLLLGFGKGKENQVYLVDFGLVCRYMQDGKHKEYGEDVRKAHDGTIEFTSRDAHIGAHSRRGDLEILGYNMLQWLCGQLPWETDLKDPEYVSQQKTGFMNNIPLLMSKCFPNGDAPDGIVEYLEYISQLKFDEEPNYKHCKDILKAGIKKAGLKYDGKLVIPGPKLKRRSQSSSPWDKKEIVIKRKKSSGHAATAEKRPATPKGSQAKTTSAPSRLQQEDKREQETVPKSKHDTSLENPTPAMLLVMQKRLEQQQSGGRGRRRHSSSPCRSRVNCLSAGQTRTSPGGEGMSPVRSKTVGTQTYLEADMESPLQKTGLRNKGRTRRDHSKEPNNFKHTLTQESADKPHKPKTKRTRQLH